VQLRLTSRYGFLRAESLSQLHMAAFEHPNIQTSKHPSIPVRLAGPRFTCSILWAYVSSSGPFDSGASDSGGSYVILFCATFSLLPARGKGSSCPIFLVFSFDIHSFICRIFLLSRLIYPYACRELKGFPVVIRVLAKKIVECFFNLRFTLCDTLITTIQLGWVSECLCVVPVGYYFSILSLRIRVTCARGRKRPGGCFFRW